MLLKTHIPSSCTTYLMALEHREELSDDEMLKLRNYRNGLNGESSLLTECDGFVLWDIQLNISKCVQLMSS